METAFNEAWAAGIFGFKPTYKGWKLCCLAFSFSSFAGFKPTYKGWKLPICIDTTAHKYVLSLPTRDGNLGGGLDWKQIGLRF